MSKVKKIAIYPLRSSGHTNVCVTIAKVLLNNYPGQVEIYFMLDEPWKEKISKLDSRFKFRTFQYDRKEQENDTTDFMDLLEPITKLPLVERMGSLWASFGSRRDDELEWDRRIGDLLVELKPDLILMDQMLLLPSVVRAQCPYAFICSSNPLSFNLSEEFPMIGSDARMNDKEKIMEFRTAFTPYLKILQSIGPVNFKQMGISVEDGTILDKPLSKHFSIYCYAKELDYYTEEQKKENKLISFDTPLIPERIPPPFELPEEFAKQTGPILYVSLGSMFSQYTSLVQRLVDILETMPEYRYIVSKGPRGDQIKLPDNGRFYGENYINQLGVLQVVDGMIAHGGNNSLGECCFFGVPCVVLPVFVDQINNGTRVEETGMGFTFPVRDYTDEQLKSAIEKILTDESIRVKWKKMSERIQHDKNYNQAIDFIFNYV